MSPFERCSQYYKIMAKYSKGQVVDWKWGNGTASAEVQTVHTSGEVKITSKGKEIRRNASEGNPVYELKQDDGTKILKSESELN